MNKFREIKIKSSGIFSVLSLFFGYFVKAYSAYHQKPLFPGFPLMEKLVKHIRELENAIPMYAKLNNSVSLASVGWHIEHSLKAIMLITAAVKRSDPKMYKRKFNFWKVIVYTTNSIPRGRAKAPKAVQPTGEINADKLQRMISETLIVIKDIPAFKKDNYFEHPYFGNLNLPATIKFLNIHTKHHLKIIKEIIDHR